MSERAKPECREHATGQFNSAPTSHSRRAACWNRGLDSARLAGGNEEDRRDLQWNGAFIPKRVGICPFNEGRTRGERSYSAAKAVGVVQRRDARLDQHQDRARMVVPTTGAPVGCSDLGCDFDVRVVVALELDIEPVELRLHMEVAEIGPYIGG